MHSRVLAALAILATTLVVTAPVAQAAIGTCDTAGPVEVEATAGTVGPTAYPSLSGAGGAFTAINTGVHQGVITVEICGDTAEAATATLNASGTGGSSYTAISIKPVGGVARSVSGAIVSAPLIDLNGADNVTIDGVNAGGDSLTLANTNTGSTASTSTIRFIGGASNNTITRANIQGSGTSALATIAATILFSTDTVALTGNDNNNINTCNIGPAGANLPSKAIMGSGTTTTLANENSGAIIDSNNIFDFFLTNGSTSGISIIAGNDNWTISNNRFYQTATRTFISSTTVFRYSGITIAVGSTNPGSFTITGNVIGFGAANGTGTTTITGAGATTTLQNEVRGIDPSGTSTTVPTSIQGNTVSGIVQTTARLSTTSGSSAFIGIVLGTSAGLFNVGNTTGNTIGSLDGSSTIVINSTATGATAPVIGIYDFSFSNSNLSNNNIGSITIQGAATTVGFRGILVSGLTSLTSLISGNTIASITDSQVGSYGVYGIQIGSNATNVTQNTIRNMTSNSNGAALIISAGVVTSTTATVATTITRNTIHSLSNSSGAASNSIYAISASLGTAANVVSRNNIHSTSITGTATTCQLWGVVVTAGTTNVQNNMVRLGLNAAGASITTGFSIIGYRDAGGTNNFYHNSAYIGGTGVVSASNTYGFLSTTVTVVRNFQDNIFYNARSNASGGISNVAIGVGGTAPNPTGLTSNYNDLFATGTDGATGIFNATVQPTLAAWRTATGQDANSFAGDPQYINPTGTSATVDLHIHPTNPTPIEGSGLAIGAVTDDFDGDVRASFTPTDVGADAGNFVPLDISGPVISYTPFPNTTQTTNRTLAVTVTDAQSGVPTAGIGLPVIYFRKGASDPYVNTQCSWVSGSSYNCVIDYSLVTGASVTSGDTIQYYVAAQDNAGNVTINPGGGAAGLTANPPAASTPPTSPNSYVIAVAYSGSYNVGTGETITSLTNAGGLFALLNAGVLTGNVTANITTDLTAETGANALNALAEEPSGSNFTLKINPTGAARLVSGSISSSALIRLAGASRVTIDGSLGGVGTDRSLTITNTSVTTPSVVLIGSTGTTTVVNSALKNSIIVNGVNTATAVVISDTAVLGNPGFFNNITIQNNDIQRAFNGLFVNGGTTPQNGTNLVVTGNTLNTSGANAIRITGLYMQGVNGATVSNNTIGNFNGTNDENDTGIWLNTGTINATVSGNTVTALNYPGTGAFSPIGINVISGVAASGNVIRQNTISSFNSKGTSSANVTMGISVTGTTGGVTIEKNDVRDIGNTNTATWPAVGINLGGGNNNIVRNNFVSRIYNDQTAGTGAFGPTFGVSGIRLNTGTGHQVYNNSVHMYGAMAGAISTDMVIGLAISSTTVTGCDVRNNILSNEMTGGNTGGNTRFAAIHLPSGATVTMNLTLNNNAYYEGTDPNCRMAVVGTTTGSGDFAAANFNPATTTPATNFRSYSSTLSAAGTNDNASLATTAAVPFVSASDLHINLCNTYPIANAGASIGSVTDDIDGNLRSATPDMGADEYTAATVPCNDLSDCTTDACVPATGCQFTPLPDASPCGDAGTECTNQDTCLAGTCVDNGFQPNTFPCGSPADTNCDNPDTCNGAGACLTHNEPNGFPCPDGLNCTTNDTCNGTGSCINTPVVCNDASTCTNDGCVEPSGLCEYTTNASCDINGTVRYYRDNVGPVEPSLKGIPDEEVTRNSSLEATSSDTTDANGDYSFTDEGGDVTLTPDPTRLMVDEDECHDSITAADASLTAQASIGLVTFTTNQLIAGDVSGISGVSAYDAALIAQKAVAAPCLTYTFPISSATSSDWAFRPVSRSYTPLTGIGEDYSFLGILYGDPTGNWTAPVPFGQSIDDKPKVPSLETTQAETSIRIPTTVFESGILDTVRSQSGTGATIYVAGIPTKNTDGTFSVVFGLQNSDGILGLDMALKFSSAIEVRSVTTTGISSAFSAAGRKTEKGYAIAMYGVNALAGSGSFLKVTYAVTGSATGMPFKVAAQANEGAIPISWVGVPRSTTKPDVHIDE